MEDNHNGILPQCSLNVQRLAQLSPTLFFPIIRYYHFTKIQGGFIKVSKKEPYDGYM